MIISAVIVTYNPKIELLVQQFKSLDSQLNNIIYVDNSSQNILSFESEILAIPTSVNIYFIKNSVNLGLGKAHNLGITKAEELNSDFVLILDHDSVLKPTFLSELLNGFFQLEEQKIPVGAVGPVYIDNITKEVYPITRYSGPFIKRTYPVSEPVEASVLISSGCLIALSTIKQVGYMNEELFIDYVDIEWSYRCRYFGYKLYAIPTAIMEHQVGDKRVSILGRMISVHTPLRRYYLSRNSIYMLRCPYISWGYKFRELTFNVLRILIFSLISNQKIKYLKCSFLGLYDGLRGHYGKCSIIKK